MEGLPLEVLSIIIDFLPLHQVFVLQRVSKRVEEACRSVIASRQWLQLGSEDKWHELEWKTVSHDDTIDWDRIDYNSKASFVNSMMQMRSIKILKIDMGSDDRVGKRWKSEAGSMIMRANSSCLQEISLDDGICLNVKNGISYPNLKRISVSVVNEEDISACPSLTDIAADSMTNDAVLMLDPELLTSLDLEIWSQDLHVLSHLLNLSSLHLEIVDEFVGWIDEEDLTMDDHVGHICTWFPKLKTLMLYVRWGRLTDASLLHVSQLNQLTKFTIYSFIMDAATSGVEKLLNGSSRHQLQVVKLYTGKRKLSVNRASVKQLVQQINQETGRQLTVHMEVGVRVIGI